MAYVIDATYEPMTFQEMLAPHTMASEERARQEEEYLKLLESARTIEDLKDSEPDRELYDDYVKFKNGILATANDIAQNNISNQTKRDLMKYRLEYMDKFSDAVDKIKKRGELAKQQREYLAAHPNTFFDIDYANTPVDGITENSSYTPYDMDDVVKTVANDVYNAYASKGENASAEDLNKITNDIKRAYNYDTLDDRKKRLVDAALLSGVTSGAKAYSDSATKQQLEQLKLQKLKADAYKSTYGRYAGTGESVSRAKSDSGKISKTSWSDSFGNVYEFTPTKDINGNTAWTYKDFRGKTVMLTDEDYNKFAAGDKETLKKIMFDMLGGQMETQEVFNTTIKVIDGYDGNYYVIDNKTNTPVLINDINNQTEKYMAANGYKNLSDIKKPYIKNPKRKSYINPEGGNATLVSDESLKNNNITPISGVVIGEKDMIQDYRSVIDKYPKAKANIDKFILTSVKGISKDEEYNEDDVVAALDELKKAGFTIDVTPFCKKGNPDKLKSIKFALVYKGGKKNSSDTDVIDANMKFEEE